MACRMVATILLGPVLAIASFCQMPASSPFPPRPLPDAPHAQAGDIVGTVTDIRGAIVPGATVVLTGPRDRRTMVTNDKGFFEFTLLEPGIYRVTASAKGFAEWTSPAVVLAPGKAVIVTGCRLKIAEAKTTIVVSPAQIAAQQVKTAEQQRVLGFLPNFYVVYDQHPEPLTPKLKFNLAFKTSVDVVTFGGVAVLAGIFQAADHPDYVQGAKGYAERYGAIYADGFIDIMIGGAILPTVLHQDPRYFYQGTGTTKSRALHALSSPFVCKGDNGRSQPNYSSMGGDLATAGIATAYYPASHRNAETVFENFLIGTAERMGADLAQEFLIRKLTPKARKQP